MGVGVGGGRSGRGGARLLVVPLDVRGGRAALTEAAEDARGTISLLRCAREPLRAALAKGLITGGAWLVEDHAREEARRFLRELLAPVCPVARVTLLTPRGRCANEVREALAGGSYDVVLIGAARDGRERERALALERRVAGGWRTRIVWA